MKKLTVVVLSLSFSILAVAQVAIGKNKLSGTHTSLEFGNAVGDSATQKGLLLPWVSGRSNVTGAVPGTMVFDSSDRKVYINISGTWTDFTVDLSGKVDTSLQSGKNDLPSAKVNIGKMVEDNVPGILVLSDTDRAMQLPTVDKYTSVVNPSPGMMVYDLANSMLCFYNGNVWSFWKGN